MSEFSNLQDAVTALQTSATSAEKALTDIAARLTALEGAGAPPPGTLQGLADQINTVATALSSAATAGEATP